MNTRRRSERRNRRRGANRAEQSLDDLLQIGLALAQILVFHLVELTCQHFKLRRKRPLGVVVPIANPLLGGAGERVVVQQHQMHVEQCREFGGRLRRQIALQRAELVGDRVARDAQPRNFGFDAVFVDEVVRHVDAARRDEHSTPDRDPA